MTDQFVKQIHFTVIAFALLVLLLMSMLAIDAVSTYHITKINSFLNYQSTVNSNVNVSLININNSLSTISTMIPLYTDSYNSFIESQFSSDPELMNTTRKFFDMMINMTRSGKLDRFFNCTTANKSVYTINYPIFDTMPFGRSPRKAIGFEVAVFDVGDNFRHIESFYITRYAIAYVKLGCAEIIFDAKNDKIDVRYNLTEENA